MRILFSTWEIEESVENVEALGVISLNELVGVVEMDVIPVNTTWIISDWPFKDGEKLHYFYLFYLCWSGINSFKDPC